MSKEFKKEFYPTPVIVFNHLDFQKMIGDWTPKQTVFYLEGLRKKVKVAIKYGWDNTHFRFSDVRGNEFTFQVYANELTGYGDLHVWDATGRTSVGSWVLPKATGLRTTIVQTVMRMAEDFSAGIVVCSRCKNPVPKIDVAGTIYAGSYCADCWSESSVQRDKALEGR